MSQKNKMHLLLSPSPTSRFKSRGEAQTFFTNMKSQDALTDCTSNSFKFPDAGYPKKEGAAGNRFGGYVVGAPHKLTLPYLPSQICGDSQEQFTKHHHFTFQFKVSFSN